MLPVRPQVPSRPCPACGAPVDPLRAGAVILLEDGFRYLCDSECRGRFLAGERAHDRARAEGDASGPRPAVSAASAGPALGAHAARSTLPSVPPRPSTVAAVVAPLPKPHVGLIAAVCALAAGALGANPVFAVISILASGTAAGAALVMSWPARKEIGWLAWALGPTGALMAVLAAAVTRAAHEDAAFALVGAGVAAGVMVGRAWLDAWARSPVDAIVRELLAQLPDRVRVPITDAADPMSMTFDEVDTRSVRTGEEVLALEGEVVAVDGVVKAGEGSALLHPGARTPVRRRPGDPLLAGARITEGAVRILATRVGDQRALVRPAQFGMGGDRDAAPIARIADAVTRWGGIAAIAGAVVGLVIAGEGTFAGQLAAASAVLLASPLASIRRGAESPLVAAAATAGARGIAFPNARSLDTAGRVAVVALCTRGTVTEGVPEVVEIQPIGEGATEPLIALAAAAESAAESHPIARAILRFAEARRIAPESVRRATAVPGRGVTALAPGGEPFAIGNRQLLLDEGVSVASADEEAASAEARGRTVVFVALGGRVRGLVSLEDDVKLGARAAVQRMIDLGIEVVLLSGDHRPTVEALARNLDIDHVKAELLPEERGAEVRRLRETGGPVAVVGRPGADDPALAAADVPIVLGAAGNTAGERAAALATEDLRDAAAALWIARAARSGAWRSTALAIGVGAIVVAIAATGELPPAIAALLGICIDAYALPTGARLLRRIALRIPARS